VKYRIFGERLLVRELETNERTAGGLFIPDTALDGTPWRRGEVIAKGNGILSAGQIMPLPVEVGEVVVFFRSMSPGEQLIVPLDDGEEGLVIRFQNCLGALEGLSAGPAIVGADGKVMTQ
jgi:chaperonin GroES